MKKTPVFLSTFFLNASINITMMDPNSAYIPVIIARFPDTVTGKISGPIPIEKRASKMQLPIVFPIASSYSFLRAAVTLTKSSGRDVPIATAKKLTMYSEM
jgi:hypothetical protein